MISAGPSTAGPCTGSLYWSADRRRLRSDSGRFCPKITPIRNFPRLSTIPRPERVKQDVATRYTRCKRSENLRGVQQNLLNVQLKMLISTILVEIYIQDYSFGIFVSHTDWGPGTLGVAWGGAGRPSRRRNPNCKPLPLKNPILTLCCCRRSW